MSRMFKELRKQRDMTQTEMAAKLDVDIKTIRNWENTDKCVPSIKRMKEIAMALDISTYDVFRAFMVYPSELHSDLTWNDHSNDFKTASAPYQLFKYIKERRLFGEGFVIYRYRLFSIHMSAYYEISLRVRKDVDEVEYSVGLVYNLAPYVQNTR